MVAKGSNLSIVVPCYNSEKSLAPLVKETNQLFAGQTLPEIILVCDDSPDSTWDQIRILVRDSSNCRGFLLGRNIGQQRATKFGISQATRSIIVTLDDDLQHNPQDIFLLLSELELGFDLVYGVNKRFASNPRILLPKLVKTIMRSVKIMENANRISAFRCFRRSIVSKKYENRVINDISLDVELSWRTQKISFVPVNFRERKFGKSNYNLLALTKYSSKLLLKSSEVPMHIAYLSGILGFTISTSMLIFSIINFFLGYVDVPGYLSLVLLLSVSFSLQFILLGILGRIMFEVYFNEEGRNSIWIREQL